MTTNNKRQARKALQERLAVIRDALCTEASGINAAIKAGTTLYIDTAWGRARVISVNSDLDVRYTFADHNDPYHARTAMLANDGRWANLCEQASVERALPEWKR